MTQIATAGLGTGVDKASPTLEAMEGSISDAIRLRLVRVTKDKTFPVKIKVPNATASRCFESASPEPLSSSLCSVPHKQVEH